MDAQKKEVIKHFDSWSATYEQEIWERDEFFHKNLRNWVLDSISNIKNQFILELGVGPGVYYEKFLQQKYRVVGIDNSVDMLSVAIKKLKKREYNSINFVLADAEFLPFREKTFDVTNCIEVLRHLPQPNITVWKVFREISRVIRKEGHSLITLPNILFPLNMFSIIYYTIPRLLMRLFRRKIGFHYDQNVSFPHFPVLYNEPEDHMFNILFVKNLARKTNLKIIQLKGNFFFPACPKIIRPIFNRIDRLLGKVFWKVFAYSFLILFKH